MDHDGEMVALTSLYIHLLDQLDWELLTPDEAVEMGRMIAGRMAKRMKVEFQWQEIDCMARENAMEGMVDNFTALMAAGTGGTNNV